MSDLVLLDELRQLRAALPGLVLLDELRQLRAALPGLVLQAVREAMAGASRLSAPERAAVDALGQVFGATCFSTRDLVEALKMPIGHRPALSKALQTLVPSLDKQRVGQALGQICRNGGHSGCWRLMKPTTTNGAALWVLEGATVGLSPAEPYAGAVRTAGGPADCRA